MSSTITTTARRFAVALAMIGTTLALSAAPAGAAVGAMSGSLKINPYIGDLQHVWTGGLISMTQAEAQQMINSGHRVQVRLWGDDPSSDNLRAGPYHAFSLSATPSGLRYEWYASIKNSVLNEDSGWYEGSGDEIYAGLRLVNSAGTTVRSVQTNTVYGNW